MGVGAGSAGLIAAGVGAAGSIGGALISSSAAGSAADTQSTAANQASSNALAQYQQTRSDLAPYRTAGSGALNILSSLYGITPPQATPAPSSAPTGATIGAGGLISPTPGVVGQGQMLDPTTGQMVVAPTLPDGQSLQYLGGTGWEGAAQPGYWAIVDQSGAPIRSFMPGMDLQTVSQLVGGGSGASSGAAVPTAPGAPQFSGPNSNLLSSYGLPGLTFQPTQAQLEATPGYQFDLSQGLLGVANSSAAKGLGISGPALKGAASFATGLANNTLTTQQGIFQSNLGNILNPLMWAANLGQNAAATTGQQGIQAVGNANSALIGGANAQAAGQVGGANALASGLGGLGNAATNFLLYNQLNNGGGGNIDTTSTF